MIKTFEKENLKFIEVTNNSHMVITLCDLGASLFSIVYDDAEMLYRPKYIKDFARNDVYHGKTIGRVAGRVKDSIIEIDGHVYHLAANEDNKTLHGGIDGLSNQKFKYVVKENKRSTSITFSYLSKAGESGFPSNALIKVRYEIANDKPDIKIVLDCSLDGKCPISLTNHSYFCLGDAGVNNLSLQVKAAKYLQLDPKDLIFTKSKVVPAYLDFRKEKKLNKDIDNKEINNGMLKGFDHCWVFDKVNPNISQITLKNERYQLNISTSLDAVVIYTDNFAPGFVASNSNLEARRGIAIEPQLDRTKSILFDKNRRFHHFIKYKFKKI